MNNKEYLRYKVNELGNYIKEQREEKEISITKLAKITNINKSTLSRIENGLIKQPSLDILEKLNQILKLDIIYMLEMSGYTNEEILNMGYIFEYKGINGTDKIEKFKYNIGEYDVIDIIKVLHSYKNEELNDSELLGILSIATCKDLRNNIPDELLKKYNIEFIKEIKKEDN